MWLLLLGALIVLTLLYLKNKKDSEAAVAPVAVPEAPAAPEAPAPPIVLDYQPQTCPSGFSFIDGQCEADCPPGQKKLDGMCVIGSAQGPTANFLYKDCPTGMRPDGNDACILDEQVKKLTSTPRKCPPGTSMVNGVCEADCPSGSKKINGKCYSPAVTDLSKDYSFKDCPQGMTVEDGFCVIGEKVTPQTAKPKTCPPGFSLVGNNCEQDCTTGYKKIDGKCYPTSVDTIIKQKLFKNCPDGFRTDPLTCQRDVQVKRVDGEQKACPTGWSQSVAGPGGMCMKDCTEGYKKHLGLCYHPSVDTALLVKGPSYKGCPDGFRTDPLTCQKDVQVKRVDGAQKSCPTGWSQSVAGPGGMCMKDCTGGQKKYGGLCYDPAVDTNLLVKGYSYKGCPDGFRTDPVTCQKDVQISRVDGAQKSCPAGWSQSVAGPGGMCQRDCPPGQKKYGGICYDNAVDTALLSKGYSYRGCPDGFRTDPVTCFKDVQINRVASAQKSCPPGWNQSVAGPGGMCRQNCTDGWKDVGGICYHPNVDTGLLIKGPSKGGCNPGDRDDGTSCFAPIKTDWCPGMKRQGCCHGPFWYICNAATSTGGGITKTLMQRQYCPDGYNLVAGMCYAVSRPAQQSKSLIEVGQCTNPATPNGDGGMCYANCPAGFAKSGPGECRIDAQTLSREKYCPAGYVDRAGMCYAVSSPAPESRALLDVGQCNDPAKPNGDAGMCYANCPAGFKKSGPGECRIDAQTISREKYCPAGYKDTAGMCYAVSSPPPDSKPLLEVGLCTDAGKPDGDAGMCYENCPAGFKKSGPGECRMDAQTLSREPYCTEGYNLQASMCYAVSKPPPDSKPLLDVGECKNTAFPNGDAGMCYQNCADGFKKSGPGECRMDAETRPREKYCPEGYDEKSDACYGKVGQPPIVKPLVEMGECKDPSATFAEDGSCYPPCPEGETREPGGKCKKAKVSKTREKFCPSGYVDQNGKCIGDITGVPKIDDIEKVGVCTVGNAEGRECWPDCPEGFKKTATGVCTKPQEVAKREKYCPEGYDQGDNACTIKTGTAPEKKTLKEVGVCKDPEFSIASDGKCYPNCPTGYQPDTPGTCKKI